MHAFHDYLCEHPDELLRKRSVVGFPVAIAALVAASFVGKTGAARGTRYHLSASA